jgi:putative 4-hydroxybenzoate polyprenyltransferase
MKAWLSIKRYASLVVFAHTLFALPFALIGFSLAYVQAPPARPWLLLLQVLGCMVTARNSAMSFNRYVDRHIDAKNARTQARELPSGKLHPRQVLWFWACNVLLFLIICLSINILCFYLAFPALMVLCGYSYVKRFSWACHFVLGLALSIAPAGAYIAVCGSLPWAVVWLSALVLFWTAGFDILYALPDEKHDKAQGLHSIPQRFGRVKTLWISGALHLLVLPLLWAFGQVVDFATPALFWIAAVIFTGLLVYQHSLVGPRNLSRLNRAFFTANGVASVVFAILTMAALFWR